MAALKKSLGDPKPAADQDEKPKKAAAKKSAPKKAVPKREPAKARKRA